MKHLQLFEDWDITNQAKKLVESDELFETWLNEWVDGDKYPDDKDEMRASDILRKAKAKGKDADDIKRREVSLANTQAKLIQDAAKAIRRGRACMALRAPDDQKKDIAIPFFQKATYLMSTEDAVRYMTDAERHMIRGVVLAAELGIGD